jgi:hypothetical protein
MMSDRPTRFPQIKKTTKPGEFLRMVIIPWLFCCRCDEWTMDARHIFCRSKERWGLIILYRYAYSNSEFAFSIS